MEKSQGKQSASASHGAVFIAFGNPARMVARQAVEQLHKVHPRLPVCLLGEKPIEGVQLFLPVNRDEIIPPPAESLRKRWSEPLQESLPLEKRKMSAEKASRMAKVHLYQLSPFLNTIYLDADTLVLQSINAGFLALQDGWDFVIIPSSQQGEQFLWHVHRPERLQTCLHYSMKPVALQGGVFWFKKNEAVANFFAEWRREWHKHQGQDQGALLRAMKNAPLRVHLLGRPYNGGGLIAHRFGRARENDKTIEKADAGEIAVKGRKSGQAVFQ